jgi:hypothetical protein
MWEPRRLTALWASTACYRGSFTFFTTWSIVCLLAVQKLSRISLVIARVHSLSWRRFHFHKHNSCFYETLKFSCICVIWNVCWNGLVPAGCSSNKPYRNGFASVYIMERFLWLVTSQTVVELKVETVEEDASSDRGWWQPLFRFVSVSLRFVLPLFRTLKQMNSKERKTLREWVKMRGRQGEVNIDSSSLRSFYFCGTWRDQQWKKTRRNSPRLPQWALSYSTA